MASPTRDPAAVASAPTATLVKTESTPTVVTAAMPQARKSHLIDVSRVRGFQSAPGSPEGLFYIIIHQVDPFGTFYSCSCNKQCYAVLNSPNSKTSSKHFG